jgi:outer membrane protein TolC
MLAAVALCVPTGCRRVSYIDQAKSVPHDPGSLIAKEDAEVQQAQLLEDSAPLPLPKLSDPRTTANPDAEEPWFLSLQEAIRIGLDNAEVVRVIPLGASGTPVGGFEPQFLATSGGGTVLGQGNLSTVYDVAARETRIAAALSQFDANFQSQVLWGRSVTPFNNAIATGFFSLGNRFPVVQFSDQWSLANTLQKRAATGTILSVTHNINFQYTNSPVNVFPGAYTTNLQLRMSQPLLGSAPTSQFNPNPPSAGLEANRAPIVVARLQADATVWAFKANVMALVRSIEQQYWALAQAQVQYWASETAVQLGEEIVRRERARLEVGSAAVPNVAEAEEQLERFRLDFINRTADLVTTERQLRNLLGLPPTDNRRIIPSTPPTEARIEPNWQAALAQMLSFQPDIVQNQLLVRIAELQLLVARNQLLPVLNFDALYQFNGLGQGLDQATKVLTGATIRAVDPIIQQQQRAAGLNPVPGLYSSFQSWQVGFTFQMPLGYRGPLADVKLAQYQLLQQRAYLQQIVHQTTHQLARFFLEVDANYKLYKSASRLKAAAKQRLEAAQAFYELGQVTIDRYLDAVNRWANAVVQEADFRTRYTTSIVLLEELKGTLLAYNNIVVAEGPWPAKAYVQARDQQEAHRRFPIGDDGDYAPRPVNGPLERDPVPPQAPPNFNPQPVPPLPAPVGPLGPRPTPAGPTIPDGEPPSVPGPIVATPPPPGRGYTIPTLPQGEGLGVPDPAADDTDAGAEGFGPAPESGDIPLDLPPAANELPSLPES